MYGARWVLEVAEGLFYKAYDVLTSETNTEYY